MIPVPHGQHDGPDPGSSLNKEGPKGRHNSVIHECDQTGPSVEGANGTSPLRYDGPGGYQRA